MKRLISICVVLFLLMILCIFLFNKIRKENEFIEKEKEPESIYTEIPTEESDKISKESEYKYYILETEGRLTVYEAIYHGVFMETAIKATYLPDHLREELKEGIYFKTEKDMFDFLESYSS